jgi:excisionase family DNA binding protein
MPFTHDWYLVYSVPIRWQGDDILSSDKWLTLDELAEYLKLSRAKLYRMAQEGRIPASKIGSQWRFDREEVDAWARSQRPRPYTREMP